MRVEVGCDAALVADVGVEAAALRDLAQARVHLGPRAEGFGEGREADRRDHELLEVDRVVGVRAPVDDVEERDGQRARAGTAEVAVERHVELRGGGMRRRQRDAEHGVRAELGEVRRAVEELEGLVEAALVERVASDDLGRDALDDRGDGFPDTFAAVAVVAVAQLVRFVRAGGRAARHGGASTSSARKGDVDLDGRVAARVEDLARVQRCRWLWPEIVMGARRVLRPLPVSLPLVDATTIRARVRRRAAIASIVVEPR